MTGVIAAAGIGAAGAIGSSLAPKLFSGQSQQQSGQSYGSNNISGPVPGSPYEAFENNQLTQNIAPLSQAPFQPYDVSSMFAPFNQTQQNAFGQVSNATGNWQPYYGQAGNYLNNNTGAAYSPTGAAQSAFGSAASTPSALSQASPYFGAAGQSTPSVISSYYNPNTQNTVNAANQLQSSNFLNNVMPGLTNQFVASGGGLGSPQYDNAANWALTNFNQNLGNTTQGALQSAYTNATGAAQNDLNRFAGLAGTSGNLALGQQAGYSNLGTAQGNNAAQGANTNIANATAYSGLGTGYLNNQLLGANALLQTGNQQQQQAQNPLTAAYQQFEQGVQWPYQTAGWAANTANSYQWPTRSNTSGFGENSAVGTQTASPVGTGVGLAAGVGSIPGFSNAIGQLIGGGQTTPVGSTPAGGYNFSFPTSTSPVPVQQARGGYLSLNRDSMPPQARPAFSDTYARGGYLDLNRETMPWAAMPAFKDFYAQGGYLSLNRDTMPPKAQPAFRDFYATGGSVPVIKIMRANTKRSLQAAQLKQRMARPDLPLDLSPSSGHFAG